ncbi:HDOD domain-containing protein [Maribrevibacterium harenarium]|uniref:HDOD domain-containing protein n=1 Tax=Maribrevibacterium harenarium TaxID=2589817 RepID=A0A501WZI5_9GAMM|nr:HDOD domain-containing protein [Maribrevibacterium harenarium]TPE51536.1 HDOD domain-containing protein [Maribrevibacterium harenarium]
MSNQSIIDLFYERIKNDELLPDGAVARRTIINCKLEPVAYEVMLKGNETNADVMDEIVQFTAQIELTETLPSYLTTHSVNMLKASLRVQAPGNTVMVVNDTLLQNPLIRQTLEEGTIANHRFLLDFEDHRRPSRAACDLFSEFRVHFSSMEASTAAIYHLKACQVDVDRILVDGINSRDLIDFFAGLGIKRFQGPIFSDRSVYVRKDFSLSGSNLNALLQLDLGVNFDFKKVAEVVKRDINMMYRFLKVANAAGRSKVMISSVEHALVYLGQIEVKKIISLFIVTEAGRGKPHALLKTAFTYAAFCEGVAEALDEGNVFHGYIVGLFSVLDLILEVNQKNLIANLGLPEDVELAILYKQGPLGLALQALENAEISGDLDFKALRSCSNLEQPLLNQLYLKALKQADEIFTQLIGS